MPFSDYLPGISAALADVAKTRAAVEAMRFDKLIQFAKMRQEAKSEDEYFKLERDKLATRDRMDTAQEQLRFEHEKKLIEARTAGSIQEINQRAAKESELARQTGNTEAARNALLAAQTKAAQEGMKLDYYQVMARPLSTFWQERGITPDIATSADKAEYNSLVENYNSWASANGFPTRPTLNVVTPASPQDIAAKLPEAKTSGGLWNYAGGVVKGIIDWGSEKRSSGRGAVGGY